MEAQEKNKLRANFAAMFMQGLLEGESGWSERLLDTILLDKTAQLSVRMADSLLKALEEKETPLF